MRTSKSRMAAEGRRLAMPRWRSLGNGGKTRRNVEKSVLVRTLGYPDRGTHRCAYTRRYPYRAGDRGRTKGERVGVKGSENGFGEPERRLIAKKAKREETKKGKRRVKKSKEEGGRGQGEGIDTDWSWGEEGGEEEGKKLARAEEEGTSKREERETQSSRACDRPLGSVLARSQPPFALIMMANNYGWH